MKRNILIVMLCAVLLCLSGCGAPGTAVDGAAWSEDWITMGGKVGVEQPGHGLTLRDDKAAQRMYYAAWSIGEAQPYTNASGEETDLYDAQLVFLLRDADTAVGAQETLEEWLELAADNYAVTDTAQQTYNGQEFTVLTYTFTSETSPFARGVSAFAAFDRWALSVELACQESFEEDAGQVMADFLEHCHYAPEKDNS